MAKLPELKHVKYVTAKGRLYAYFNTGKTKPAKSGALVPTYLRLPDPGSVGFYDSYAAALGARTKRATTAYTVADMARDFENSPWFASELASNTQVTYTKTLRRITELLGDFPADGLERHHVQPVLDKEMRGASAYNMFAAVLGTLYKWGRGRGKTDKKPSEGIAKLKTGSHEPWPEDVLEAALASDDEMIRLAVHLLYFTGQRIGDVLKMRWSDIRRGRLCVIQQKTGKELWLPLLSELKAVLDETPKRGMTILASANGKAIGQQTLRPALQAFTLAMGHKTVPHGLRKNAVIAFLEAECSVPETAAITGQTYGIVEYYARRINQMHMADSAVLKLENKRGTGKRLGKQGGES